MNLIDRHRFPEMPLRLNPMSRPESALARDKAIRSADGVAQPPVEVEVYASFG